MKYLVFSMLACLAFPVLANPLVEQAQGLDSEVARRALGAVACQVHSGHHAQTLIVVDMAKPSNEKRLWAFDITNPAKPSLVLHEYVAHGIGSDPDRDGKADTFSNTPDSLMTSLGLYKVAEKYQSINTGNWARRLDGLMEGFNSKARERAVVMHPAHYVRDGRVGNSEGCPAVKFETMEALEKAGLDHALLWIDGPDTSLDEALADCVQGRVEHQWVSSPFEKHTPFQCSPKIVERVFVSAPSRASFKYDNAPLLATSIY